MNEKSFRGWNQESNEWVDGPCFECTRYGTVSDSDSDSHTPTILMEDKESVEGIPDLKRVPVDERSVGRKTGICLNEKDLFEGDVLTFKSSLKLKEIDVLGVVRFGHYKISQDEHIGFYIDWLNQKYDTIHTMSLAEVLKNCKKENGDCELVVIGNVCQNERIPFEREKPKDRGWDVLNETWVYGTYMKRTFWGVSIFGESHSVPVILHEDPSSPAIPKHIIEVEIDEKSVGRSTGGFVNGKELFEGDIVTARDSSPKQRTMTGVVCFGEYEEDRTSHIGFHISWITTDFWSDWRVSLGSWLDDVDFPGSSWENGWKMTITGTVYEESLKS